MKNDLPREREREKRMNSPRILNGYDWLNHVEERKRKSWLYLYRMIMINIDKINFHVTIYIFFFLGISLNSKDRSFY